jgi:hypothetical protein
MFKLFAKTIIRVVLIVLPAALLSAYIKDTLAGQSGKAVSDIIVFAVVLVICILGLIQLARKPRVPEITRPPTRWESDKAKKLH